MKRLAPLISLCLLAPTAGNLYANNHRVIDINDMLIVSTDTPKEGLDTLQDMPMGQGETKEVSLLPEETSAADDKLFGIEGGYVHPYVSVQGDFTDNLYNVDDDTTSNFLTTISPGIWFSLPRTPVIPITIAPSNAAPGGLANQIGTPDATDTLSLYALAGANFLSYSEDSNLNTDELEFEAMARYNMASGLSLQLVDRFSIGHDQFSIDGATDSNLREYKNNIAIATADWELTEKLSIKGDFSNFYVDYNDSLNDFLNRTDNSADFYAFFNYSIKSSLFVEYKYVDVAYDTDTASDNNQSFYYGGVTWDTTDKLSLLFKAGIQQKEFEEESEGYGDSNNLALDLQIQYSLTAKTKMSLDVYNLNEESDSSQASEKEVFGASFNYNQLITEKITGSFDLLYENADYNQLVDQDRADETFGFTPSIQYLFKDWLMGELSYSYENVDSSDDLFDYDTNTVFFSLNFSL